MLLELLDDVLLALELLEDEDEEEDEALPLLDAELLDDDALWPLLELLELLALELPMPSGTFPGAT